MIPWARPSHNPNCITIGSTIFAQVRVSLYFTMGALSPQIGSSHRGIWTPIRAHNPNSISIGSAIFPQMTAECICTLQYNGTPLSPLKIAPSYGEIWTPSNTCFLDPPKSITQTASWSVQPFVHSSWQSVSILYNGPPFPLQNCPFPWGHLDLHLINGS